MDPLTAMRALGRRWRRAGRGILELLHGTVFPRAALERAARQVVDGHVERLAAGRRVLDECGETGQPPGDAGGVFDLIVGRSPALPESIESTVARLAPGGQMVVAVPPDVAEGWYELLCRQFLRVERARLLASDAAGTDLRLETVEAVPVASEDTTVCEVLTASAPLRHLPPGPRRLHVGAGGQRLEGWINVDIRPFPGVDLVADVTRGIGLTDVDAVFAEHFLEHLAVDHALGFLAEVRNMLTAGGRLRLSTPNLEWVWRTHYRLEASPEDKVRDAVTLNRAFHGWEHKFIWNRETLDLALSVVGFRDLTWHRHGESGADHLRGLERHETYGDDDDLPHVLIVEAVKGAPDRQGLEALRERLQRDFLDHVAGF